MNRTDDVRMWGIHTMNDTLFLRKDIIAIGWPAMGDLNQIGNSRDEFKSLYEKTYPESKKGAIPTSAGMLYRFVHEVQIGDYVVFPSKIDRKINIGIVESDYLYNPAESEYVQQRKVKWVKHLPRTSFTQGALYEVGSALTFFSIKNYTDEYLKALDKTHRKVLLASEEDDSVIPTAQDIVETTKDFILKSLSSYLKGYALEEFVANLLNAMGYRTSISAKGGDSGIDIQAYKDEFPPRILVQVKSQDGDIKESTIQSLKGAMREGDYGLFITLSDYTKKAQAYLNSVPIIRGINGAELVDLILKYYDDLAEKYKRLIPLKMVYIPAPDSE